MTQTHNLDNVQHERARKIVDPAFVAAQKELDRCYYGEADENGVFLRDGKSGWKYGHSAPFRGYDILIPTLPQKMRETLGVTARQEKLTPDQARRMFDMLSGAMQNEYRLALLRANIKLEAPYEAEEINKVNTRTGLTREQAAQAAVAEFEAATDITARELTGTLPER